MSQEWMIDVLTDLKSFARKNGLMGLAEQLDDTILVAAAELNPNAKDAPNIVKSTEQDHRVSGAIGGGENL